MFSMCSELTPCTRIPDTRIPQFMQPCLAPFCCPRLWCGKNQKSSHQDYQKQTFSNVNTISSKSFCQIFLATCLCKSGFAELEIKSDFSLQPLILLAPQTISAIEILITTISCNGKLGFGIECICICICFRISPGSRSSYLRRRQSRQFKF